MTRLSHTWAGGTALLLSVAVYAAASIAMRQPFHLGGLKLNDFDLQIYRLAALRLIHGAPLYATPMLHQLGFTYPPFAAMLLAPLALGSLPVDAFAATGLNLLLLVFALRRAMLLRGAGDVDDHRVTVTRRGRDAWWFAAAVAAVALWLEPVSVTLGYGQINLLITALVVYDLSRPDAARTKGAAIGLAAAIKLTPLLFIAYLLLSGRVRAAGVAALTFLASIALSVAVLPGDASAYWLHCVMETSRIGSTLFPGNQSLTGAVARFNGNGAVNAPAQLSILALTIGGLGLAARASRRGDEDTGFALAALSTLLASPISWSHHWTLAVPALVLLARRAHRGRSRALGAAAVILGLIGCAYLPEFAVSRFGSTRGVLSLTATDPYPLVALLVLTVYACARLRLRVRFRVPTPTARVAVAARAGHGARVTPRPWPVAQTRTPGVATRPSHTITGVPS